MPCPEVEDVTGMAGDATQDVVGLVEHSRDGAEQQGWIEIALQGAIEADAVPRHIQRDTPVDADHITAGVAKLLENGRGTRSEMNRRHASADGVEDPPRVRQRELAIIVRAQVADPRIEHLHGVDAGVDLRAEIVGDDVGQLLAEAMPGIGMPVHQRLRLGEVVRMSAFDRVRGERERRSREADERDPAVELLLDLPDRCQHV
jgi:hypothetical protein